MKAFLIMIVFAGLMSCTNNEATKDTSNQDKDSTIGVDSTKVGADSGILRKLP